MNTSASLVEDARAIFRAAVQRVQPPELFGASEPSDWALRPIETYDTVRLVGLGKAAMAMAGVVEEGLGGLVDEGTVIVPEGAPDTYPEDFPAPSTVTINEGGHPIPTQGSVRGARRIVEQAEAASEEDLLIVLVSGGGTALSTLPREGLDLHDLKTTYHHLLTGGVDIHGANAVRKHLTQVGGGQLARIAHPADVVAPIVSDVVGDVISVIASGPTVPDPSTYEDAMQVLYQNDLWHDVPAPIRSHIAEGARGNRLETPGPGADCFERTKNAVVATNRTALDAAKEAAESRGYRVASVQEDVSGEARTVGEQHARTLLRESSARPTCWLWGGEPTVTVTGDGNGGRNQEVALGASLVLEDTGRSAVLLSGGTDGIDGPTDAAGAWATPSTADEARAAGCDPQAHLEANDAYPLFEAIDQLIRTGPTHTNVMDVQIGLTGAP
ncbi:MAG: glycerate kinase [Salinibacter sp.]|uniref:glycerate kinase n=1 Tax=Salinibacter sp. TaxID=2065818 RepID=UPI0035D4A783